MSNYELKYDSLGTLHVFSDGVCQRPTTSIEQKLYEENKRLQIELAQEILEHNTATTTSATYAKEIKRQNELLGFITKDCHKAVAEIERLRRMVKYQDDVESGLAVKDAEIERLRQVARKLFIELEGDDQHFDVWLTKQGDKP